MSFHPYRFGPGLTTHIILFLLLCLNLTPAQALDQDLVNRLSVQLEDSDENEKAAIWLDLARAYDLDNPVRAYNAAEQAQALGQRLEQPRQVIEAQLWLGRASRFTEGAYDRALSLLNNALHQAREEQFEDLEALVLCELVRARWSVHDLAGFDSLLTQAHAIAERLGDPELLGATTYLKGTRYYYDYDTDQAQEQWLLAKDHYLQTGTRQEIVLVYLRLSVVDQRKRDPNSALENTLEALRIAEAIKSEYWELRALTTLGNLMTYSAVTTEYGEDEVFNRIEKLAERSLNPDALMKYHNYAYRIRRDQGMPEDVIPHGEEFLRLATALNNHLGRIQASLKLCNVYRNHHNLEKGLDYLLAVKDLSISIDYRVSRLYTLIAKIYHEVGELDQALQYQQLSWNYERDRGFPVGYYFFYFSHIDRAVIYRDQGEWLTAYAHLDSALTLARENEALDKIVHSLMLKGEISLKQGNLEQAELEIQEALDLLDRNQINTDLHIKSKLYHSAADLYFRQQRYQKSVEYAELALKAERNRNWVDGILKSLKLLAEANEAMGRHQAALRHLKEHHSLHDSIYNAERDEKFLALKEEYENGEKQLRIELLESDKALDDLTMQSQEESLQRSSLLIWSLIIIVVILVLVGALLFNRYMLRKKAKELSLQNKQLELERANQESNQQLEMMALRSSFLTNVSHEIRTPLTLIKGPLALMRKSPNAVDPEWIDSMEQNADRLMSLVNQAMQFSKVGDPTLPFQPTTVPVSRFVNQIMKAFRPLAKEKEIELKVIDHNLDFTCELDRERIERALINLVSNAFRYTEAGGSITIEVARRSVTGQPDELQLSVADTGQGIAAEHLPHLFERYYRADQDSSTGFGLGLSIVKDIVTQHGGQISVTSEVGQGTTFTMLLPVPFQTVSEVSASPAGASVPVAEATPDVAATTEVPASVLVVEDNDEIRKFLVDVLGRDYHVITAINGQDGENKAREHLPNLIVSDVMMPDKDGYELVQALKSDLNTSHIPIILLTAKATHEDKIKGLEIGADDYLYKPLSPDELTLKMRNLLQQQARFRRLFSESTEEALKATPSISPLDAAFLEKANAVVLAHLEDETFNVATFCEEMALNRTSVHNKLKALTGYNTSGFLKSVRVQRAIALIHEGTHTFTEIADLTGFTSRFTFNRAFKEQTGKSPSVYRDEDVGVSG